ncbi:Methyltransferase domain-containing protein [Pseudobutyrivibrio sp. YE44]|uniref:cation:dicarboxylate symporter family transporter n=1 Tax=Pseudobutyrivibrio sp. YE44 TaxID=1520802 RepID=UPI00088FF6EB|nr:cation:dicarboxylase symporter family transporter [Pseudobutyrivibrio sp. YE44]SDB37710.1 Methyltransferase domain-containing protein [Pseudobutyrivibrio sp. YE44]
MNTDRVTRLRKEWVSEERIAQIHGWDFSHINGRYEEEEDLPWDYRQIINENLIDTMKLLDFDTGGGEFLLSLEHPYKNIAATEGYPPNVDLCRKKLCPLGIDFRACDDEANIPFEDATFDVLINRHGRYNPKEARRLLKVGGLFITQQVGGRNDRELINWVLPDISHPFNEAELHIQMEKFEQSGFSVIQGEEASPVVTGINSLNVVFMKCMEMILKLSPIGVFCLICPVVAANGSAVLGSLAMVLLAAYCCYALHMAIVYSTAIASFGGISPLKFFKAQWPAMIFAFSSASSVGTLPINMKGCETMGADKEITSFVLPLGATINMDGTAIYQGVCAIFIASCYGVDLTFSQMLTIVLTATLASIGTAGVPGAGMVMLAMVLTSVGLPVDGIALVAGIDRIFDMGRTVVNITGDASCAVVVSNLERKKSRK